MHLEYRKTKKQYGIPTTPQPYPNYTPAVTQHLALYVKEKKIHFECK